MSAERKLISSWPALGPALAAVLLALRLVFGDGLDAAIGWPIVAGMVAIAVLAARRLPVAGWLMWVVPIAFLASPARTELSFNLARPDDRWWYALTLGVVLSCGLSIGASVALLAPDKRRFTVPSILAGGLLCFAAFGILDPQPDLGTGLTAAQRAAAPTVGLLNYGYAMDVEELIDGNLQVQLVNDSTLPHTFSVDAIDLDIYVPAGRRAFVNVPVPADLDVLDVYCAVGDHTALGMVGTVIIRSR